MAATLIHQWLFNEGSGNAALDNVGSVDLSALTGNNVNWGRSSAINHIFSDTNRAFYAVNINGLDGSATVPFGSMRSTTPVGSISQPSISVLFREVITFTGAFIRFESGSYLRTSTNGNIDLNGNIILNLGDFEGGMWNNLVVAASATGGTDVYLNGVFVRNIAYTLIVNGYLRIGSYNDTGFVGGCELADLRIQSGYTDAAEVSALYNSYGARQTEYKVYANGNLGGFTPYTENKPGLEKSYVNIASDLHRVSFDGDSCCGGMTTSIPHRLRQGHLYGRFQMKFPTGFDSNHDLGPLTQIFQLSRNYGASYGSFRFVHVEYEEASVGIEQPIEKRQVFFDTTLGTSFIDMVNRYVPGIVNPLPFDDWITVEWELEFSTGTLIITLNGDSILNSTGINFGTSTMSKVMYGIDNGIHPQNAGNYIDYRELYIGEVPFSPATPVDEGSLKDCFVTLASGKRAIQIATTSTVSDYGNLDDCFVTLASGKRALLLITLAEVDELGSLDDCFVKLASGKKALLLLSFSDIASYGNLDDCFVTLNNGKRAILLTDDTFLLDIGNLNDCFFRATNGKRAILINN